MKATGVGVSDIGYFDNMLHDDNDIRKKKHEFMKRVLDAAVLLGVEAVCGFVGRNQTLSMDQNLVFFEEVFIPLLKEAKARGLSYRVEQCPMPGWTTSDNFHNNIALRAGPVDRAAPHLREARRRRPAPHPLRSLARDPDGAGHALALPVPEGRGLRLPDRRLPRQGSGHRFEGRIGLGLRRADPGARRLDRRQAVAEARPTTLNAWKKQVVLCEHELPGTAKHDPLAYLQNRTVDWLDHQLAARELLKLDVANTHLVVEHEYPKARIQDKDKLKPILQGSIAFTRKIDEAAACMFALQHEVLSGAEAFRCRGAAGRRTAASDQETNGMAKKKLNVAMIGYAVHGTRAQQCLAAGVPVLRTCPSSR